MAGKNVFPNESVTYVKDSSGTERTVFDSSGGLYPSGVLMTPPSTVAWTAVGTVATQSLTNKTVNNITITDPGSSATLTVASGGTLETAGAFQVKFTAGANSAVTVPSATDAVVMWTTETVAKITAKTSQINVLGVATWPSTIAHTLVGATNAQTLEQKTWGAGSISYTESPTSAAALTNYGVSVLGSSALAVTATLAAPSSGLRKVIVCNAASVAVPVTIFTGSSSVTILGTSAAQNIVFSTVACVELIGVSTAQWALLSDGGGLAITASTDTGVVTWARPTFTTSTT